MLFSRKWRRPGGPGQAKRTAAPIRSEGGYSPAATISEPNRRPPLDPRQDFAKECVGAASLEKDLT
ncbi:hypothetical protein ACVIIV_004771 [Bradyrhizobium sp. USDA 4354]